ncbi:DDE transposase, partial [[Clostridium] scindens]
NPQLHVRVATIKLAKRTSYHAEQQRSFKTEKFKEYAHFRNGVVRGLIRCRLYFGFKVAAMNVRKLFKYMSSLGKCALTPEIA